MPFKDTPHSYITSMCFIFVLNIENVYLLDLDVDRVVRQRLDCVHIRNGLLFLIRPVVYAITGQWLCHWPFYTIFG